LRELARRGYARTQQWRTCRRLMALLAVASVLCLALPATGVAWWPDVWSAPVNVSQSDIDSWKPAMALDAEGNVHVVWYDQTLGSTEGEVYYARWARVSGWSDGERLSTAGGESSHPVIAVGPGGIVHVVWQERAGGASEIRYACLPHNGAWTPIRNVSNTPGDSVRPLVVVSADGQVHVIWQETRPGRGSDIYYVCQYSSNLWTSPHNVSQSDGDSTSATLLVDAQGNVHVCWQDLSSGHWGICYASRSSDGEWSSPQDISSSGRDSTSVAMACSDSGVLHVVWSEDVSLGWGGDTDVFYAERSPDGAWTPEAENLSNRTGRSDSPVVAVDDRGGIHVAWQDVVPPGLWKIYSVSRDLGGYWSKPELVSGVEGNAQQPAILAARSVDAVWAGGEGANWEICHAHRRDDGSWSAAVNVSRSDGTSAWPIAVCDDTGALRVVWQDNTMGPYDILHARTSLYAVALPVICGNGGAP